MLIKIWLNETCSIVKKDKHCLIHVVFRMVCNKEMLYHLCCPVLEHGVRKVQANQERLKLSRTHHLLLYTNDVN